jgi:hypothetical protein
LIFEKYLLNDSWMLKFSTKFFYKTIYICLHICLKFRFSPKGIGHFSRMWITCWFVLLPETFKLFGFQIFKLRAYLMKVIPETCRAHKIWNLLWFSSLWHRLSWQLFDILLVLLNYLFPMIIKLLAFQFLDYEPTR